MQFQCRSLSSGLRRGCGGVSVALVTTFSTGSRARLRHASAGPQPGTQRRRARAGRERKRELRRAAPPGRWRRRGKAGVCPRPGRRRRPRPLACGRCRARRPTPGGRPRYRQAGGGPPSRSTRHRAERQPGRHRWRDTTHLSRESVTSVASPLDPARDYPGGGRNLSRALLRRVPSGRPLTEPRPQVPRTLWRLSG